MKYLVGTNIKMYRTWLEANQWLSDMNRDVPETDLVDVALFPPYFSLVGAAERLTKKNLGCGAQNMCGEERGPFTGEISPLMLKELGCRYVELGHHERRLYFNENDEAVNHKIALALAHGLAPLVCVGEDEERRRRGSEVFLAGQMETVLRGLTLDDPARLIIAYEPRWAIGQKEAAPPEHARRNCDVVRESLCRRFGPAGRAVRVVYGGSVNPWDVDELLAQENINGLFIGRTALDTAKFAAAVEAAHRRAERDRAAASPREARHE